MTNPEHSEEQTTNQPENQVSPEDQPTPNQNTEQKPADQAPEEPKLYTVKVDGEEIQVTEDELVNNYQLSKASQQRMQQAAEERKKLQEDVELAELTRKAFQEQDQEAALKLLERTTNDPAQIEEFRKMAQQVQQTQEEPEPQQQAEIPEEMKQFIAQYKEEQAEKARNELREQIFTETEKKVASDEILGKIENEQAKSDVAELVKNEVQRRVACGISEWPDVLGEVMPWARQKLKNFGTLGRSGSSDTQVGFTGTPSPEAKPQPKEPPKKANINDPEFEAVFGKELRYEMQKLRAQRSATPQQAMQ